MDGFTIRPAEPGDAEAILTLHRRVAATPGGPARAPDEVTADYVARAMAEAADGGINLVAVDVAGVVRGEIHVERMKIRIFAHVLTSLTVAVDPDWQGRGVGTALFEALIAAAKTLTPPVGRIELWTGAANTGAQRLYGRMGFRTEGRMTGRGRLPSGLVDDYIVMGLMLD